VPNSTLKPTERGVAENNCKRNVYYYLLLYLSLGSLTAVTGQSSAYLFQECLDRIFYLRLRGKSRGLQEFIAFIGLLYENLNNNLMETIVHPLKRTRLDEYQEEILYGLHILKNVLKRERLRIVRSR
jgi:hypothetical protein